MTGYHWSNIKARNGRIPSSALQGGHDVDGDAIYVGRAFYDGDWIPAKVIPAKNVAYIAYNMHEIAVDNYEILCEQHFEWEPSENGDIPEDAVVGGKTSDGENLYIGRVHHDETAFTVGKVHPSHKTCYIPFDGQEQAHKQYEVLVLKQ